VARPSPGVARVVGVLDFLAEHPDEMFNLSELCRRVDMNKATAHSLLGELTDAGYLVRDPVDKTYGLGPRLLAVGLAAGHNERAVLSRARRHLRRLAGDLDARCVASTLRGDEIVILEVAGRERPFRTSIQPGNRLPFVPPVGAVFIAWSSATDIERWLARAGREVAPGTQDTYRVALQAVRRRGCSLSLDGPARQRLELALGGDEPGAVADAVHDLERERYFLLDVDERADYELSFLAAPVFGPDARVVLAVTVYDLPPTSSAADVEALVARVLDVTRAITAAIGGTLPEPLPDAEARP
jgi:DNA-binding IclR family transcriptional regulator